jgi:hypothetical protein
VLCVLMRRCAACDAGVNKVRLCTNATASKLAAAVSTQTAVSRTSGAVVYDGGVPSISVYGVPKEARLPSPGASGASTPHAH